MASHMPNPRPVQPVNPINPVVVVLCLAMIAIEGILTLAEAGYLGGPGGIGWRSGAVQRFAFSGEIAEWMVEQGRYPVEHLWRFVTYPFLHGGFIHAIIGCAMLLALGKMVGDSYGTAQALVFFVVASVGGALAYTVLTESGAPLIGSYPAVYGYVGAFTYVMWVRLGAEGAGQARAFSLIGFLLGIQLLFGVLYGGAPTWVADLGGFVCGLAIAPVLAPGGWRRLVARLRRR